MKRYSIAQRKDLCTMPNFSLADSVFEQAAQAFPTPFHLYDEKGLRQTARSLNAAFAWAPGFQEYFAVKALPNPHILRILKEENCGVDCSSECELLLAEMAGFSGEGIMFSANAMPPAEFAHARALSAIINLDDISDIDLLKENGGIPQEICIRYNPGGEFHLNNFIMGSPGDSKYGWTPQQLLPGLEKLKALGVKKFGLHAFLVSNTTEKSYYPKLSALLFETGRDLAEKTGLEFSFVNLSGGIGIPYRPEEEKANILHIGEMVKEEYYRILGKDSRVKIKTELGRFMTGPNGWLVTRVIHEKNIHKHYIGVDACASNLMRPAMYGAYHHIHICGKRHLLPDTCYDVTGCLCENNDKFAVDRMLPRAEIGDLMVIHDTGAHGHCMGYQYNGRLRSAEILLQEDGSFRMIRRAETPADYFATLVE